MTDAHIEALANWQPGGRRGEVPLTVARVVLQDFTGTPLICDLAAMRDAAARFGKSPELIEPQVPVQLVIDHSVQINATGPGSLRRNTDLECQRNRERYEFFKWGTQAFENLTTFPPGSGIVHQINLEHLAQGVGEDGCLCFPDTLVGTDSHTTMINGIGILGWGVGGIEAETAMLGQPIYLTAPDVVGVALRGQLREGVTTTDAVLVIVERLRQVGVVGKFVEFHGDGAANLSATDRSTIANMAPEYGATTGFFPVDGETIEYYRNTGRSGDQVDLIEGYFRAQGLFGMPAEGQIDYSDTIEIDLSAIEPCVAGPKRPQDRIALAALSGRFDALYQAPVQDGGYDRDSPIDTRTPVTGSAAGGPTDLGHGDILIAAITSCTNTSNPKVLIAAGLLAQKAVAAGLTVPHWIKTSFAPGSRAVTEYLKTAGLMPALKALGFDVSAYGCAVCAGNSGPLEPEIEDAIRQGDLVCAAVLSGNRIFEARIHPALRANFLMSLPLVVAYALAGTVRTDLSSQPIRSDPQGKPVYLTDIWPSNAEIEAALAFSSDPETYRSVYVSQTPEDRLWDDIECPQGSVFDWKESAYVAEPPLFRDFGELPSPMKPILDARALVILGDSITTDHISPAGRIDPASPAGQWLVSHGTNPADFNTYGAYRGQHEVMIRGTFANVRLRNALVPGTEGGFTRIDGTGERQNIFDASRIYRERSTPLVVIAGKEYGCGSSRDWAAKGTAFLGVRAVIAQSFERIHRSNLVGMGVLPCQFNPGDSAASLGLDGTESISIEGLEHPPHPGSDARLVATKPDGTRIEATITVRIDSTMECEYFRHGGMPSYLLRNILFADDLGEGEVR